jgi:hypothetical protein
MKDLVQPASRGELPRREVMQTLGAPAAEVRLIVWCLDCRHQVEPLTGRSGLSAIIR